MGLLKKISSYYNYHSIKRKLRGSANIRSEHRIFFIVSAGRSGSTLLRKHLLANKEVSIPPESENFIPRMVEMWFEHTDYGLFVTQAIAYFSKQEYFDSWQLDWESLERTLVALDVERRNLGDIIFTFYQAFDPDAFYYGDKTPFLVYYLDWIKAIFPNSRIIYLVRDGRAVINSYINSRGYDLQKAMHRWKGSITSYVKSDVAGDDDSSEVLKYEDFILDTRSQLINLCTFINVPFEEGMLDPEFFDMGDTHLAHHANVKNEINKNSLDKWKEEMTSNDILYLNNELKKELSYFEYI